jgi:hypothetical protein
MAIDNLAGRFEHFRQLGPKLSLTQKKWMDHLERHLDAGDVVCTHFDPKETKVKVICPECEQGKCRNCDGSALNTATDDIVDCECSHES